MCGFAGILRVSTNAPAVDFTRIKAMSDIIRHRGPDDAGYCVFYREGKNKRDGVYVSIDEEFKSRNPAGSEIFDSDNPSFAKDVYLAFGHRRLSVIDLSYRAHQPFFSDDKSKCVVYNGEIYNFRQIRKILKQKGYSFKTTSDTEVLIKSYEEWGIDCVEKFDGMFAFALWDGKEKKFFLARDRYGIIPVYYYFDGRVLVFGSEVKAILKSNLLKAELDVKALNEYFTFQNIFTDRTLFKDVRILTAGCWMEIGIDGQFTIKRYWDYEFESKKNLSECSLVRQTRDLFIDAVERQIVSDVPLGGYLSGGMDTGSIVSVARNYFPRMYTFTVGFDLSSASGMELGFDERKSSEELANLLKTEHYEAVLHAGDMEAVLPDLIWHIEEPRVGQSYPDYYAARLASKFVKVVLSGTGGDELFGGYPWRYYRVLNPLDREDYYRRYYQFWQRLVSDEEKERLFRREIYSETKEHPTFEIFKSVFRSDTHPLSNEDYVNESMYFEAKTFLHGLFVITNKISMAHSLETRVPFMDNALVKWATSISPAYKLKNLKMRSRRVDENELLQKRNYLAKTRDGKIILRKAMQDILPSKVLRRGKQGFSAPDASWFRGESIEYIKKILLARNAAIYDWLDYGFVKNKIEEHIDGRVNHRLFIWSCLSFEWWLRKFL